MSFRRAALAVGLMALGVACDQASKAWVQGHLPGNPITVIPGALSLVYVENRNASFGIGGFIPESIRLYVLLGLQVTLSAVLLVAMARTRHRASRIGYGVVVAGAVGNVIDRVRLGYVVDFIYWHGGFTWPNFNVADVLICTGVGILLVFGSGGQKRKGRALPSAQPGAGPA